MTLEKRARKESAWLRRIEHIEGSYATSNGADVIDALLAERVTLKAALQKARGYVVERLNQGNHYDGPPRPGFVEYDLMMIDAALAACVTEKEKA